MTIFANSLVKTVVYNNRIVLEMDDVIYRVYYKDHAHLLCYFENYKLKYISPTEYGILNSIIISVEQLEGYTGKSYDR